MSSKKDIATIERVIFTPLAELNKVEQDLGEKKVRCGVVRARYQNGPRLSLHVLNGVLVYPPESEIAKTNITPYVGVGLSYLINYDFSIGIDWTYYYRNWGSGVLASRQDVQYRFGRETNLQGVTPNKLHYLSIPIYAQFHPGKHIVEGGFRINRLLGIRGTYHEQTYGQLSTQAEIDNITSSSVVWIDSDQINKWSSSLFLGYKYRVLKHLQLGFRMNYLITSDVRAELYTPGDVKNQSCPT